MLTYFIDVKGFLRPTLLRDVRYCPEASQTLLSMYHLEMYSLELSGRALYHKRKNFQYKYLLDTRENSRVFQSKILIHLIQELQGLLIPILRWHFQDSKLIQTPVLHENLDIGKMSALYIPKDPHESRSNAQGRE